MLVQRPLSPITSFPPETRVLLHFYPRTYPLFELFAVNKAPYEGVWTRRSSVVLTREFFRFPRQFLTFPLHPILGCLVIQFHTLCTVHMCVLGCGATPHVPSHSIPRPLYACSSSLDYGQFYLCLPGSRKGNLPFHSRPPISAQPHCRPQGLNVVFSPMTTRGFFPAFLTI